MRPYWLRFLIQGQINLAHCATYAGRIFRSANPQPPTLAFGDEEAGGAALAEVTSDHGTTSTVADPVEQPREVVPGQLFEGERAIESTDIVETTREADTKAPDFTKLGKAKAAPAAGETNPPEETAEQKAARARHPDGRFAKQQQQEADAAAKKAADEAEVKRQKEAAVNDPSKQQQQTQAKKLPTKDEIEKMELPPGASQTTQTNFKQLRSVAAEAIERVKAAEQKAAEYETQLKEVKEKGVDPDKLKEYEADRRFRELWEAGNHPRFQAEWSAKEQAAEGAMIDFLKQYGAKETAIEALKANGIDSEQGRALISKFDEAFGKSNMPLERAQLTQLALARRGVTQERQAAIKQLETNREGFVQKLQDGDRQERDKWVQDAQKAASEFVKPDTHPWAHRRVLKGDETPEQKTIAEKHNERVDRYETRLKEVVGPLYQKDPKAVMETVFGALKAEVLQEEKDDLQKQLDQAHARIKELSDHTARVRSAGQLARRGSTGTGADGKPVVPESEGIGGDARSAMDKFFNAK